MSEQTAVMAGTQYAGAMSRPAPTRERLTVGMGIERLGTTIDLLAEHLDALRSELGPVLEPERPAPAVTSVGVDRLDDTPYDAPFADSLLSLDLRVTRLDALVSDLASRLRLR